MRYLLAYPIVLMLLVSCANYDKAETLAGRYARVNYPGRQVVNVMCQHADSDGDGYVSCNVALKTPAGEIIVPPLECSGGWAQINEGCRYPKAHGFGGGR